MNSIPSEYNVLFWDTDPAKLSITKHKSYIIERILEYGDLSADRWLKTIYPEKDLVEVVKKSKRISLKTANFYAMVFNIDKKEIECFKHPFTQKQNRF